MNPWRRPRQSPTRGRTAEAAGADLVDRVDLSPRERLVFSVGLLVANGVLEVAAWLDRHYPVRRSFPLANHSDLPHGPRSRGDSGLFVKPPDGRSAVDEGRRSRDAVVASRRLGHPERSPLGDRSDAVTSERYERSA